MLWIPMLQSGALGAGEKVTPVAPPHWLFWMMEPPALHACCEVQVDPSENEKTAWMVVSISDDIHH
jgi:hypothetical protein